MAGTHKFIQPITEEIIPEDPPCTDKEDGK